jgi:hypothetical protein
VISQNSPFPDHLLIYTISAVGGLDLEVEIAVDSNYVVQSRPCLLLNNQTDKMHSTKRGHWFTFQVS